MKILHILAQLPMKTGSGVYFTNLIEGLKAYDDIEQACLYGTSDEFDIAILDKNHQFEVVFESDKLPFPIVGMSDKMPYKNTIYSEMTEEMHEIWQKNFKEQLEVAKERFNPDIIITHHLWILSSMVCDIFADKKIFGVCHNTDIRQAEKHPQIKEKYVKNIDKLYKIFSLSNNQIDDIVRVYGYNSDDIINIGAGYNEKIFYPLKEGKKTKVVNLVFAGKFDESKGFYELIKAFREISKEDKEITLDLIGNIDIDKDKILEATKGIEQIAIYNVENQQKLADVLREKDIFILPSYFEGLGLIAVEALGSGLRVVSTEIDGLMELLGEEINSSDIIEYVKLPRIYDTDKAYEEDKPDFVNRLAQAIKVQIRNVRSNNAANSELFHKIIKHSWQEKIKQIYKAVKE